MVFAFHLYAASYWIAEFKWLRYFHDPASGSHKSMFIFYPYIWGYLGVTLFFVLSGYCIHLSFLNYLKKKKFELPAFLKFFFIRRIFRIYPAYLLAVAIFFVWKGIYHQTDWPKHLISHLTFTHNTSVETYGSINGAFWSLAYEWQLYCLYPFFSCCCATSFGQLYYLA